jgi:MHS family alpha-ketoglutarate permease-like MFS transporter
MEWFDANIYATFAAFFAGQFFTGGPGSSILATFAVFAVGFAARPVGGVVFGWLADRGGRRPAMLGSVGLVAAGSLVIGLTPATSTIGVWAPILLVSARLAQGVGAGGELPAAQTYLAEIAPRRHRGLWGSSMYASGTIGMLAGTLLGAILTGVLTHQQMTGFGWRIPFLLGGLVGIYVLVLRAQLPETSAFTTTRITDHTSDRFEPPRQRGVWRPVFARPVLLLQIVGLGAGLIVPYYVWGVAAPTFAITARHTNPAGALWASAGATLLSVIALPLWGALSDRIGRRPVLAIPRVAMAVLIIPLDSLVRGQAWQLLAAMTIALVTISASTAINPAVMAELFPTGIRAAGLALPNAIAVALFGGTAPYRAIGKVV